MYIYKYNTHSTHDNGDTPTMALQLAFPITFLPCFFACLSLSHLVGAADFDLFLATCETHAHMRPPALASVLKLEMMYLYS